MPGHREPSISVIEEGGEQLRRMRVEDVKNLINDFFQKLLLVIDYQISVIDYTKLFCERM